MTLAPYSQPQRPPTPLNTAPPFKPRKLGPNCALAHPWWFGAVFSVAAMAILVGSLFLSRTYTAVLEFDRIDHSTPTTPGAAPIASLDTVKETFESDFKKQLSADPYFAVDPAQVSVKVVNTGRDRDHISITLKSPSGSEARQSLNSALEAYTRQSSGRVHEAIVSTRQALQGKLVKTMQEISTQQDAMNRFRQVHPGALPDDPNSLSAKYERITTQLDQQQQDLDNVTAELKSLADYKQKLQTGGSTAPVIPNQAPAADPSAQDAEVIQLSTQIQLMESQIEDQKENFHRTDQHPFVVELRRKEADLRKRMEAAIRRAKSGQPPPADIKPLPDNAAEQRQQAADLQIQDELGKQTSLQSAIKKLQEDRERLAPQVEGLRPLRDKWMEMTAESQQQASEQRTLTSQLKAIDQADENGIGLEIANIQPATAGNLPTFPNFWMVLLIALISALMSGLIASIGAEAADSSIRSPEEFIARVEAPLLGMTDNIGTPDEDRRRHMTRVLGAPLAGVAALGLVLMAIFVCRNGLSQDTFNQRVHQNGASAVFDLMHPPS